MRNNKNVKESNNMATVVQSIFEARIERLTLKRDEAIRRRDYHTAWLMNMKIDKNINRLAAFNY